MTAYTFEPQNTEQVEALSRQLADICIKILVESNHCEIAADTVARALFFAEHIVSEKSVVVSETLARLHGELINGDDIDDEPDDLEDADL